MFWSFKRKLRLIQITSALLLIPFQPAWAVTLQSYPKEKKIRADNLSLSGALEKMRKNGPGLIEIGRARELAEANYKKAKYSYWAPSIKLEMSSNSEGTFLRYKGTFPEVEGTRDRFFGPTSSPYNAGATLTLFSYEISNGGIATLDLEKAKITYESEIEKLRQDQLEKEREMVKLYFRSRNAIESLDGAYGGYQLWKTVEQIIGMQKRTGPEVESDKSEVKIQLNAAEELFSKYSAELTAALSEFNLVIGEPPSKRFVFTTDLKFASFNYSLREALLQIERTGKEALPLRSELKIARIEAQKAIIEQGIKPTLKFDGLKYTYSFAQNTGETFTKPTTVTTNDRSSSNLNLSLSMSLSVDILGPNGFFQHLTREERQRDIIKKEENITIKRKEWESKLATLLEAITKSESDIRLAEDSLKETAKQLDYLLERLSKGEKFNIRDLKEIVVGSTTRSIAVLTAKLEGLSKRIEFDNFVGVETVKLLGGGR